MELEEFMKLLSIASKDRYGNLYVNEKDISFGLRNKDFNKKRWYFTLTNTVCDDLVKGFAHKEKEGFEVYDRHFIDDDTLQIRIVKERMENKE